MIPKGWPLVPCPCNLRNDALGIASWMSDVVQYGLSCFLILLIGNHRCLFREVALYISLQHLIYVGCGAIL